MKMTDKDEDLDLHTIMTKRLLIKRKLEVTCESNGSWKNSKESRQLQTRGSLEFVITV